MKTDIWQFDKIYFEKLLQYSQKYKNSIGTNNEHKAIKELLEQADKAKIILENFKL